MTSEVPTAQVDTGPRFSPIWIVPVLAAILAASLSWQAWGESGLPVTILFEQGHGLRPGDTVRHLGIVVGKVDTVSLASDRDGIEVRSLLDPGAEHLARAGSRFWIVRPEFGVGAIAGLDTLVGNRYIAVLTGSGAAQSHFIGLSQAPIGDALHPGLDITLEGPTRGSLVPGSPLIYRRIQVGSVLSLSLSSDGRTVEVQARVRREFAGLIRRDTRFWDAGGLTLDVGLSGVRVHLDTLETLIRGGVSLAVPEGTAEPVSAGHRFILHREPESAWLEWQPTVAVGQTALPAGSPLPRPARATLTWEQGLLWSSSHSREGWVLGLQGGLLAPADLLDPGGNADEGTPRLQVAGVAYPVNAPANSPAPGLSVLALGVTTGLPAWPRERQRRPDAPEDCLAVGDSSTPPLSLSVGRFTAESGSWLVDEAVPLGRRWHGAAVMARSDGRLIGLLLITDDDEARVVTLPHPLP